MPILPFHCTILYVGFIEIAEFRFELLSHMTVVPQQYTLHCVSTGYFWYSRGLYYKTQNINFCTGKSCVKQLLHSVNNTYDNTVKDNQ